jgi:hypothetical protein
VLYLRGKNFRYVYNRRLVRLQSRPGQFGEVKNLLTPPRVNPPHLGLPAHSPLTIMNTLSRLPLSIAEETVFDRREGTWESNIKLGVQDL